MSEYGRAVRVAFLHPATIEIVPPEISPIVVSIYVFVWVICHEIRKQHFFEYRNGAAMTPCFNLEGCCIQSS